MTSVDMTASGSSTPSTVRQEEPAFAHIVRLVRTALSVPYAAVVLAAPRAAWVHAVADLNVLDPAAVHPLCDAVNRGAPGSVLTMTDVTADPRLCSAGALPGMATLRGFAGVPLILSSGEHLGMLFAGDIVPRTFYAGECSMLSQLADCVVRELELRQRAASDDLTGFLTRKPFFETLQSNLTAYKTQGTPASLAILDLDHFKSINDRFGHATGDHVLACVAGVCRALLRDRVTLARLGGEEFGFVFPGMDANEAVALMDELRAAIENIRLSGVPDMMITCSIGLAGLNADIATASAWCKMADAVLYGAKQAGRNCVIVARETRALPAEKARGPVLVRQPNPERSSAPAHTDPERAAPPSRRAARSGDFAA